jgi:response regulator RpfG family c-di-GMP phosphodiesterase
MVAPRPTTTNRLVERLVEAGKVTREQGAAAIRYAHAMSGRIEEALLDAGAISEAELLKFLASVHKTRFVSTERLARADIDRATLDRVPKKLAEQTHTFPVLYDAQTHTLSVVTGDPEDLEALRNVQIATKVREVRAFVARPSAVRAAINRAYNGDIHAFAFLDTSANAQGPGLYNSSERSLARAEHAPRADGPMTNYPAAPRDSAELGRMHAAKAMRGEPAPQVTAEAYTETLNVLVSLLENARAELRGHSGHVARFARRLCERFGLTDADTAAIVYAAHLHDLGKMGAYHLTAFNVAEYEGHRVAAEKSVHTPARLMDGSALPPSTTAAMTSMYERFDGKGVPNGLAGKDIPLGARILAIADTYADLTQNSRNPFRKILRPVEACEVLAKQKGAVFDPALVELFTLIVTGDDLKNRLLGDRHVVLIVDPDPEETTVLELRLVQQGFVVQIVRSAEQALKVLETGEVEVVLSEIDLPNADGFGLLGQARQKPWGKELAWVIMTRRHGRAEAQRAFDLGVVDFLPKPVNSDVLAAKLKTVLEQRSRGQAPTRGVTGSLSEMALPDIVQILWHGRKTGTLKVRSGGSSGEIHFVEGNIYDASFGASSGADAFCELLGLREGDFALVPATTQPERRIEESPEMLLLEAMRRIDEGSRA